ncbi:TetR/AcrR family transcriptional regulator [Amycolatopsis sp. H20-H5]|uniref:TetR/AcrR family transcriptional regulator n=1 Tax=Amycolatopsis sp. H20-H5 TaxID=3046309 RepID=UPI002DBAACC7|nr:TetR/AcrR family transcriptional regulator [Amycolatopsis sp. H20-H5]MEC3981206.1 TetR/AcrR family transcriptional regulator [Amycolatopsis sp. H20-H5]
MTDRARRAPTGAAVLQPELTAAITEAVLDELATQGYGRLSMEAVAKRAGVGKSALYRRWPSKQEMVLAVISDFSVALAEVEDTGSLRGDLEATLKAVHDWLGHPRFSRILPDMVAEIARTPGIGIAVRDMIGGPRRARAEVMLKRAIARGELSPDINLELAMDFLAAPIYWRVNVRHAPLEPSYFADLVEMSLRALDAREV